MMAPEVEVVMRSERFKFNAAHFVCFPGYRERLHGHNYTVGIRLMGPISPVDGYVMDFGDIKKTTREVCAELNERFLCPCRSDVLQFGDNNSTNVTMKCEDGSFFSLPRDDCAMLPIVHSTAEELAALLWRRIIAKFGVETLRSRGITRMEVSVAEAPSQEARYLQSISAYEETITPSTSSNCTEHAVKKDTKRLRGLFDAVHGHPAARPYIEQGDLEAIGRKLGSGHYAAVNDLADDLKRMILHSRQFHDPSSQFHVGADTLDKLIQGQIIGA